MVNTKENLILNTLEAVRNLDAHAVRHWFKKDKGDTTQPVVKRPGSVNYVKYSVKIKHEGNLIDFIVNSKQEDWGYEKRNCY